MEQKPLFDKLIPENLRPDWPKGTEVVAYCWEEDREAVARQVELMGYKLDGFTYLADHMHTFVGKGQGFLALKSALLWEPNPSSSTAAWWDNMIEPGIPNPGDRHGAASAPYYCGYAWYEQRPASPIDSKAVADEIIESVNKILEKL